MHPQSSVGTVGWFQSFFHAKHFGSVLALSFSLFLAACGGGGSVVTENDLPEPGADGIAPTLTSVSLLQQQEKNSSPDGVAKLGQSIKVDFTASEALMLPVVTINGVEATLQGKIGDWSASREMVESDVEGYVTFNISFSDTSGEVGVDVSETTDGSRVQYCIEGCVAPVEDPLVGEWMLDGVGAAGVGPTAGSMEWFTTDADVVAARACWFDDSFVFGADGSFSNEMGTETWVEAWQGGTDSCGAPVAPHDGTAAGTFSHDVEAGTLTINGRGAHLGLPKAVNGQELATPSAAPDSITYTILTLTADGMNVTVTVETAPGVWWTFNLAKVVPSALAGTWKLDGAGAAGVGPTAGSMEWFTTDAAVVAARACWFDDSFVFGAGGSFSNEMGTETWVEAWQGGTDSCGAPVAPHDGTAVATFSHDVEAGTLTINGLGAHLGLPKAVNGQELATPSAAPDSITYNILTLTADGMNLTVTVETAPGVWWTFNLAKTTAVVTDPVDPVDPVDPETGNVGTGDNNILDAGEVINFNSTTPGIYTLEDFGNNVSTLIADPTDATNTVVSVIKGNETWAGTTITSGTVIYPLTSTDTVMTVRVWSPEAGVTVRLKLEEIGNAGNNVEKFFTTTVTSGWEEMTFPFSAADSGKFNKVVIFFDLNANNTDTYYFDDLKLYGDGSGGGGGGTDDCPEVPEGELLANGDFEAGDVGCWQLLTSGVTISNTVSNGGTYSAELQGTPGPAVGLKMERFGTGLVKTNTSYTVQFDVIASVAFGEGGVFKAFTFSEGVDGGTVGATQHILTDNTTSFSTTSWETKTYTFTTPGNANQVEGGLSLLLEIVNSAARLNVDNISVKETP